MSNTNNNLQTQTSNALHNAIMEAGGKDRPPMLAPGNYNLPYKFKWTEKTIPVAEGIFETTTEGYMENYKNVSQDIRDQLNAKAEAVQIILTRIDNDIYSTVDACANACEMWKAIERLKQEWQRFVTLVKQSQELKTVSYHTLYDILKQHQNEVNKIRAKRLASAIRNRGKAIVNSSTPTYDQEPALKIYKPTNNNPRTSLNTSRANQENSLRINKGTGYDNLRVVNVARARENVGAHVVQKSGIQCYNCKEYRHISRECQKLKRAKDAAYHKEKMLLCKQEEAGVQLNAKQADWKDDTNDEPDDQELEAHYIYDREQDDQDDTDDLAKECDLLTSLIEKLKCEIDDSKN
ncbi:integrase, catalytic region, zinc finger, CCHC-type containing protein [Tanacetum coccineum]